MFKQTDQKLQTIKRSLGHTASAVLFGVFGQFVKGKGWAWTI
jgi:hypothetical protein